MKILKFNDFITNESTEIARGTKKDIDSFPVPYDDDYLDRYGPTRPEIATKTENDSVEKYVDALNKRIEYVLNTQNASRIKIESHQDEDNYWYEDRDENEKYIRLFFNISFTINRKPNIGKCLGLIINLLRNYEKLKFPQYTIYVNTNGDNWDVDMSVETMAEPDKNGKDLVLGSRYWDAYWKKVIRNRAKTYYKKDEDDEYDYD